MSDSLLIDVIQIVSTVIAFVALAVSFWFSRRQLVLQERQSKETAAQAEAANAAAQAAAQRAAASAALTIDDLSRIAVAVERLAAQAAHPTGGFGAAGSSAFEARAAHEVAAWRLTGSGQGSFLLTNVGGAAAYEVWVGGSASLDGPHGVPAGATVAPGASLPFTAQVLPTTIDSTLTVTWADVPAPSPVGGVTAAEAGPERHSWRYPLPGV